jgi:hypothetical protein
MYVNTNFVYKRSLCLQTGLAYKLTGWYINSCLGLRGEVFDILRKHHGVLSDGGVLLVLLVVLLHNIPVPLIVLSHVNMFLTLFTLSGIRG